ncbi:MAG: Crp/Fnr family transcriptional regulator [Firmicutes bacterium]|jgi:CRP/FNR family transcriptional regulator|nr:Crp/Fnr family transcriptional regulator [Bacillota bacterium]
MERAQYVLRRIPFFSGLSDEQRRLLEPVVVTARYRKGQILFVEGEPSRALFFIYTGRVKVYRLAADGREQILHLLGDGEPVAVVPFLDGGPYPANAEVLEDSELAQIQFSDFERIALANPDILMRMLRLLAQRMRESQEEITRMSLQNVAARLARRILDLCERHGRATEEGIEVDLSLTRQELGSWIGASRETATRLLQQFQREGVLRIEGSRIIVLKPLILQSWSEA